MSLPIAAFAAALSIGTVVAAKTLRRASQVAGRLTGDGVGGGGSGRSQPVNQAAELHSSTRKRLGLW